MEPKYFERHLYVAEESLAWRPPQYKYYDLQRQNTVWFAIRKGWDPTTGRLVEHAVTANFFVFRSCMLGSGSVGMTAATLKNARAFAFLDLERAKRLTRGHDIPGWDVPNLVRIKI